MNNYFSIGKNKIPIELKLLYEEITNFFEMKVMDAKFYLLKAEGKIVSCCSYFRPAKSKYYCLMNGATISPHRRKGYFKELLELSKAHIPGIIYGRTNNNSMKSLLKDIGFKMSPDILIVPIRNLISKK